jgi:hypothetical protein
MRVPLTLTVLLLAVAGCGMSDEEHIQQVFKERLVAGLENDHERACELLSPECLHESHASLGQSSFENCLAEGRQRATPATPRQERAVAEVEVVNVTVEGDTAIAYLCLDGSTLGYTGTEFRRMQNGEWRYDGSAPTTEHEPRCIE